MKDALNGGDAGAGAGGAPPAALTLEQVQAALAAGVGPTNEALGHIADRVEQLARSAAQQNQQNANAGGGKGGKGSGGGGKGSAENEFLQELIDNGEAVIEDRASKAAAKIINERLVPFYQQRLPAERNAHIAVNRSRVDTDYGDGFFDTHVGPLLLSKDGKSGALATMTLADQSMPEVVEATVDGILGRVMANPEARAKMLEGLTKTENARAAQRRTLNPPRQLGPGLPRGTKASEVEIPEDVRSSLADMKRSGIDLTEDDLVIGHSLGNSADDWDAHFRELDKKNSAKGKAA